MFSHRITHCYPVTLSFCRSTGAGNKETGNDSANSAPVLSLIQPETFVRVFVYGFDTAVAVLFSEVKSDERRRRN